MYLSLRITPSYLALLTFLIASLNGELLVALDFLASALFSVERFAHSFALFLGVGRVNAVSLRLEAGLLAAILPYASILVVLRETLGLARTVRVGCPCIIEDGHAEFTLTFSDDFHVGLVAEVLLACCAYLLWVILRLRVKLKVHILKPHRLELHYVLRAHLLHDNRLRVSARDDATVGFLLV